MPSWKGDITNPVPNLTREADNRSEKVIDSNRAQQVRRDTDDQRNFTISLYDIDNTILEHLNNLQLQVQDGGQRINVPSFFGSPEQWVSAQRDGYIRDNQGKVILPLIILKRTTSENDQAIQLFNRYLNTPAVRLYSPKNKYTQFSILSGQNAPVTEVFNVVVPSHVVLTYHFIVWTEKVEQMNDLILKFQFNTKDYWGSKKGFRFRTRIESFSHTTEVATGEDRVVKTEFDLVTHGYVLPDSIVKLDTQEATTKKFFTPKKVILGAEVVGTKENLELLDKNQEKWRNANFPNLQKDVPLPVPPVTVVDNTNGNFTIASQIIQTLTIASQPPQVIDQGVANFSPNLKIVAPPTNLNAPGEEGLVSYDADFFYIYAGNSWRRVAISQFS